MAIYTIRWILIKNELKCGSLRSEKLGNGKGTKLSPRWSRQNKTEQIYQTTASTERDGSGETSASFHADLILCELIELIFSINNIGNMEAWSRSDCWLLGNHFILYCRSKNRGCAEHEAEHAGRQGRAVLVAQ